MYRGHRYIDSDAHIFEPSDLWERYLDPQFRDRAPRHRAGYTGDPPAFVLEIQVEGSLMPNFPEGRGGMPLPFLAEPYGDYAKRGFDPSCYRDVLARTGIDYMVVYPTVGLYVTAAPRVDAALAAAYRRAYNRWLADFCDATGPGVVGVGAVDLRDPIEAAREARKCVRDYGFRAVTINPEPVCPAPLHDPFYDPLWAQLAELDVPLGVHVAAGTALQQVGAAYFPEWSIGRSTSAFTLGAMLACMSLVAGGVLARHPQLRAVFLESGAGWVPFWLDRMAAGIAGGTRGWSLPGLSLHPVDYFKRQCFVSADPDDPGIEEVVRALGDENVVTATDFGHVEGKGYVHALDDILALPRLSETTRRKIMWDNPARLYGLG